MSGKLFVIATPLGNLDDLSGRALQVLRTVGRIACEDTRRTAKLLARYDIRVPLVSCHRFNEGRRTHSILDQVRAGENVALVSDGGTPGISDPGALVVRAAHEQALTVCPIPGPSAVTTLLSASGLPADRYVFEGFLPHRAGERRRRLREWAGEARTIVCFESPHRIDDTLSDLARLLPGRRLVLGRELTKINETLLCGTAESIRERLGDPIRGEITLAIDGAQAESRGRPPGDDPDRRVADCWERALSAASGDRRVALQRASKELGTKKAELYRMLAELGLAD